jgi:hypothetical protein
MRIRGTIFLGLSVTGSPSGLVLITMTITIKPLLVTTPLLSDGGIIFSELMSNTVLIVSVKLKRNLS